MTDLTPIEAARLAALFAPLKDHPSPYPPELFEAQRAAFVAKIREENIGTRLDEIAAAFVTADPETRDELIAEAAELMAIELDGSDTNMSAQLDDAGFGSQGPM